MQWNMICEWRLGITSCAHSVPATLKMIRHTPRSVLPLPTQTTQQCQQTHLECKLAGQPIHSANVSYRWFLGLIFTVLIAGLNQFFTMRCTSYTAIQSHPVNSAHRSIGPNYRPRRPTCRSPSRETPREDSPTNTLYDLWLYLVTKSRPFQHQRTHPHHRHGQRRRWWSLRN